MPFKKLGNEQAYRSGIVSSTIFNVLGKALLFLSTLLVTYYFGTTQHTDLLFFLQNTQIQVCGFILVINMAVIIPRGIYLQHNNDKATSIAFYNVIFLLYFAIGVILLSVFCINPVWFTGIISKFSTPFLQSHQTVLLFLPVAILLNFMYQLMNDIFSSFRYFTLPVLINSLYAFILIAVLFLFNKTFGGDSYAIAILAALLLCIAVQFYMLRRLGWHFSLNKKLVSVKTWWFIGYSQLGQAFTLASSFLPFYLLSGETQGALSAYNITLQLISLPSVFAISQFSVVAGIKFTEYFARNDWAEINATFKKSIVFLLYAIFPIAALLALFGEDMLKRFIHFSSAESLRLATGFILLLALTIPVNVINTVMARLLMATQKIKIGFVNQALQNALLVVLSFFLFKKMGAWGLPIATLIMQAVGLLSSFIIARLYLPQIDYLYVVKWLLLILLLNGILFFTLYFIKRQFYMSLPIIIVFSATYLLLIFFAAFKIKPMKNIVNIPFRFLKALK
ncbi:MAG: lipid II flippase MurJ [Ferruginibacter sp.]